jgi:hypothetical protein
MTSLRSSYQPGMLLRVEPQTLFGLNLFIEAMTVLVDRYITQQSFGIVSANCCSL